MPASNAIALHNCQAIDVKDIPVFQINAFRPSVVDAVKSGMRIATLFVAPSGGERRRLFAVLADDNTGSLYAMSSDVADKYPAITPDCTQAHLFEREIAESADGGSIIPMGHPWLKPVRSCIACAEGGSVMDFFKVTGEEVHEVAVGPVHAGIIEPGHFRFQCHGEHVLNLEISLGYQHRGIERALVGGPDKKTLHYMQTAAGDTTVGHTTAYCHLLELLTGEAVSPRAQSLRGIALELERIANHTGDLGALAGDVGYLPTSSFCGRIRGDFLNMTALLCGNRFGRGLVVPGGVGFDMTGQQSEVLTERLTRSLKDLTVAVELLWNTPSVLARFEETGKVQAELCRELGMVGVAARACGVQIDNRFNFPAGIYRFAQIPVSASDTGDVFARAFVRWLEVQRSIDFIREQLEACPPGRALPEGRIRMEQKQLPPQKFAVSLVEGWRGEICHVGMTGPDGSLCRYKIVDPSFHNWTGLAMALRGQQISDFPLCNKSFNLSYCGHDL